MSAIEHPDPAQVYDDVTTWRIKSRRDAHVEYTCDLTAYKGNGMCMCDDFNMRFAKLLGQGETAESALEKNLVKLRTGHRRSDALRCFHLVEAFTEFERHMVRVFVNAAKKTRAQSR